MRLNDEWREHWPTAFAAMIGFGASYAAFTVCASLFIVPMQAELGWSRSAVTIAPIAAITAALLCPAGGFLLDRFGTKRLAMAGMLGLVATYLLLAALTPTKVTLYALAAGIGGLATISSSLAFCRGVASCFPKGPGLAFGVTLSGSSVIGAIAVPLIGYTIEHHGWRSGFLGLAGLTAFVALPVVGIWFRDNTLRQPMTPASAVTAEGVGSKVALRTRGFWSLALAYFAVGLPLGGVLNHLYPLLLSKGLVAPMAAAAVSAYTISIGVGRIVAGALLDRFSPGLVVTGCFVLASLGALSFGLTAPGMMPLWMAVTAAACLGWAQGAEMDFLSYFSLRLFGVKSFATITAVMSMVVTAGLATGGLLFSFAFDASSSYDRAMLLGAALFLIGALVIIRVRLPARNVPVDSGEPSEARSDSSWDQQETVGAKDRVTGPVLE